MSAEQQPERPDALWYGRTEPAGDGPQRDATPLPPAGWYADPEDAAGRRYWDGAAWTAHRAPVPPTAAAGAPAYVPYAAPVHVPAPSAKQPVVAVILSILLPGVGHLYAGDSGGLAIALLVLTVIEVALSVTIILIPLAFLIWLPCAIWGAIDSRDKARRWNLARGLPAQGG